MLDSNKGFSLVEILVAVMILAIICTTIWVTFSGSLDAQFETRLADERIHEIRSALDRMAQEISQAFLSKNQSTDKRTQTIFLGSDSQENDRLDFTSFSHLRMRRNARESDQCEISYYTESNGDTLTLFRREDPYIDEEGESGGKKYILLENLLTFNLRYYDVQRKSWSDVWDSEKTAHRDRLPSQVEIKVTYKNHRDQTVTLQTRTLIYLMEPLEL